MKKLGVFIIISMMIFNTVGCQKKNQTDKKNQTAQVTGEQEKGSIEEKGSMKIEETQEPNNELEDMKGKIVILPEGTSIPEGAFEIGMEGVEGKTVLVPEGVSVPEGSTVLMDTGDEGLMDSMMNNSMSDGQKKILKDMFPTVSKDIRTILVDNAHRIDSAFDMKNMQILLVSNTLHTAYLINSQDEKYGKKDELVEYSTDTFKDNSLLVQVFNIIQFNNKPTYIFNIDFFAYGAPNKNRLIKSIVHEAVHLVLQKKIDSNMKTVEELMGGTRATEYPVQYEARQYRAQMMELYKKALETDNEVEKIDAIKKANYFYKKYLDINDANKKNAEYDRVEGQARYYEYKALAILEGKEKTDESINQKAKELYLDSDDYKMGSESVNKDEEYYSIGSMAYALIYDLGKESKLGYDNPVKYLFEQYGYVENEGNKKLALEIKSQYDKINLLIKSKVDDITNKLKSDDYVKIRIPVYAKYEENGNVSFTDESIHYKYNNNDMTIDSMSREMRLGNTRILLRNARVLSVGTMDESEDIYSMIYIMIPKQDVEINNTMLTVQTKQVQIYDAKFVEKDGMYHLVEK